MTMNGEIAKRLLKAARGAETGDIRLRDRFTVRHNGQLVTIFEVWSCQTNRRNPRTYQVVHLPKGWRCTCPDFEKHGEKFPCKHILYVQALGEV
jgi:hypothetical protein